jgi:hypothetical protein
MGTAGTSQKQKMKTKTKELKTIDSVSRLAHSSGSEPPYPHVIWVPDLFGCATFWHFTWRVREPEPDVTEERPYRSSFRCHRGRESPDCLTSSGDLTPGRCSKSTRSSSPCQASSKPTCFGGTYELTTWTWTIAHSKISRSTQIKGDPHHG